MSGTAYETYFDGTPTNGANPWIDSLAGGGAWRDSPGLSSSGGPVTISYAFPSGWFGWYYYRSWTGTEIAAAENAFSAWEAVANIDFVSAG